MFEAAPAVGQVGRDPVDPRIQTELRVEPDDDVSKVVMRLWYTGFRHRHFGAQRIVRPAEQTGQCRGDGGQHPDGDRGTRQLRAVPHQRAHRPRAVRAGVGALQRSEPGPRCQQPGAGVAYQPAMGARRIDRPPGPQARRQPLHLGHRRRPAEEPGRHRRTANAVGHCVRGLHDHDGARAGNAGNAQHRREHMQPPGRPANVQLVSGEAGHGRQAAVPAAIVQVVASYPIRLDGRRDPLRISQPTSLVDPHRQLRARVGPTADLLDGAFEITGFAVERVELEVVAGDLARHPVELRIDGRHPMCRHGVSRVSR